MHTAQNQKLPNHLHPCTVHTNTHTPATFIWQTKNIFCRHTQSCYFEEIFLFPSHSGFESLRLRSSEANHIFLNIFQSIRPVHNCNNRTRKMPYIYWLLLSLSLCVKSFDWVFKIYRAQHKIPFVISAETNRREIHSLIYFIMRIDISHWFPGNHNHNLHSKRLTRAFFSMSKR